MQLKTEEALPAGSTVITAIVMRNLVLIIINYSIKQGTREVKPSKGICRVDSTTEF